MSVFLDTSMPEVSLGDDTALFRDLWETWRRREHANSVRSMYYDGEATLKDFGISLPPQMSRVSSTLGWTAKGVHAVTDRSNFEGFVDSSGSADPFDLAGVLDVNDFDREFNAARVSSAVHGCAFLTVTRGVPGVGEPEVLILAAGADRSAGLWDRRTRSLSAFMTVGDADHEGRPSFVTVYTRRALYDIRWSGSRWESDPKVNPTGVVTVAPLVYGYELRRPLGHSRVTRASMGFVDSALRTIVRSEVSSEFYSAPEYWIFGPESTNFVGDPWSSVMGRIKALETDSIAGEKVELHRFTGASPQPHTDQLRMWQALFADDQDLEVKFADSANPSSADAIFAAKETLITTTRDANRAWGRAAVQAAKFVSLLRDGEGVDMSSLSAQFTDPAIVSPSARADAFSKLSAAIDGFGASEVGMEFAGLTREQINRFQGERQRAASADRLTLLAEAARELRTGGVTDGVDGSGAGVPDRE